MTIGRAAFALCLACIAASLPVHAEATAPLAGRWMTFDDDTGARRAVVLVSVDGRRATGRIVEVVPQPGEPADPDCTACRGSLRGRKIRGLDILRLDLAEDGRAGEGTVLDPEEGREYRCTARLAGDGKRLALRGYVGLPLFGRDATWAREP